MLANHLHHGVYDAEFHPFMHNLYGFDHGLYHHEGLGLHLSELPGFGGGMQRMGGGGGRGKPRMGGMGGGGRPGGQMRGGRMP